MSPENIEGIILVGGPTGPCQQVRSSRRPAHVAIIRLGLIDVGKGCFLAFPHPKIRRVFLSSEILSTGSRNEFIGISAAVIAPGYQPWTGATGSSHPGAPITADMLFNMGSIAKTFEAALALQLAEEGALDLDRPISTWLPAYPRVDPRITPRQLLNQVVTDFREMQPNRTENYCCTGGGGAMSMAEYAKKRLSVTSPKADQIKSTGAAIVATAKTLSDAGEIIISGGADVTFFEDVINEEGGGKLTQLPAPRYSYTRDWILLELRQQF